ncbi:amino acid ABC transporter ATP-binding protein [Labrys monachus]|uniref:Polar amino acid transport system ATP-binding protein n=1 Tax=Labrys monachus TaxID=217067 RepID=A0ABU0FJW1_9HYPH|nr:amino acid ABC transporter ATP-binding protein [Labrys monachus]MDQ0394895.1 polar amino acid transport system ATP-binding protein [Labrys monachus]
MSYVVINGLACAYGTVKVLEGIDLSIEKGEVVSLIGSSGSGKSTLLRVLMGLTPPSAGAVRIGGVDVNYRSKEDLRTLRDRTAIVFQQYNLFQNMDVLRNVMVTPVKIKKRPAKEVEAEARALLEKVGLAGRIHAYPDELSGGQQQRVAIARALALHPAILLLDEVTSALDPELVTEVLDIIRTLAREGMTMLIVSHEMSFVREVSSRVAMMDQGRIIETGTPQQIFAQPRTDRTRDFVGKILHQRLKEAV